MSNSRFRHRPAGAIAALLPPLLLCGTASAQTTDFTDSYRTIEDAAPRAVSEAVATDDSIYLDPVLVSTRGRVERLQDAPASVKVMGARELETGRRDTIDQVIAATPNVTFFDEGSMMAPSIAIRGVGGTIGAIGMDRQQGAAMFLDGVYLARPAGLPSFLMDAGGVEIARGPQAVLHGRSATAGTINLTPIAPGPVFGADLELSGGLHAFGRAQGAVDVPVSDKLQTRTSFSLTRQDGSVKNWDGRRFGDVRNGSVRLIADMTPSDNTTVRVSADYSIDESDGWLVGGIKDVLKDRVNLSIRPVENREIAGASVRAEHDFGPVTLTSITAFRGYNYDVMMDGDYQPRDVLRQAQWQRQRQFTQELRLAGDLGERLNWMVGGFYLWESLKGADMFDWSQVPRSQMSGQGLDKYTNSLSGFAQLTWQATDALEVEGGVRYTYELQRGTATVTATPQNPAQWVAGRASANTSFNAINPELTLRYRFSDDFMTYGRISNGWRAGGIGQGIGNGAVNIYAPEKVWSYEIGAKTEWLDRRLNLNVAAFYNDWSDLQAIKAISPLQQIVSNADAGRSWGFEIEGALSITEHLKTNFGYGFTHAKFTDYKDPILGVNYDNKDIPQAPRHTATVGLSYERPVSANVRFLAGTDYNYTSNYYFMADNAHSRGPVNLVNMRIGFAGDDWKVLGWMKNALDDRYLTSAFTDFQGLTLGTAAEGRTLGVTASYTF
ncbi:TonB-dependent receptor [Phaeovibrio sulfidiphilus]|uniref:TonB-dependent receptor n=1 Tax=Phaeovibrio sulfidiphilus TaxID=1220600 RepID=A0A8J6YM83_9PROT|nr:TonB-dependent receptor [Phaeovibrio sulfidiphilus]MBE1237228.1 TonB-dependent receptor [Phaeovibrio sulfidiphilus]